MVKSMSAMSSIWHSKTYLAAYALAACVTLTSVVPALASSHGANDVGKKGQDEAPAAKALYERCVVLARSPHWTDSGWIGAPSAHRQNLIRICSVADDLLRNGQSGRAGAIEGPILALSAVSRPSAFSAACRDEARSGPRSLRALNWRNSPHQSAKMALCDQYERALVSSYFDAQLR